MSFYKVSRIDESGRVVHYTDRAVMMGVTGAIETARALVEGGKPAAIIEEFLEVGGQGRDVLRGAFGSAKALLNSGKWVSGMGNVLTEVNDDARPTANNILQDPAGHDAWEDGMKRMERVLRAIITGDVAAFDQAINEHAAFMDTLREMLSQDKRPTIRTQALYDMRSSLAEYVAYVDQAEAVGGDKSQVNRLSATSALALASKAGI